MSLEQAERDDDEHASPEVLRRRLHLPPEPERGSDQRASLELAERALTDAVTDRRAARRRPRRPTAARPAASAAERAIGIRNRSDAQHAADTLLERGQLA